MEKAILLTQIVITILIIIGILLAIKITFKDNKNK